MWGLPSNMGFFAPAVGGGGGGTTYVNSVQHVAITIAAGSASNTATISSIGLLAFIINGHWQTTDTSPDKGYCRVELTNSTTVTAYRNTSASTAALTVYCCVVDATSDLIVSVQQGTVSLSSAQTSNTATVSSVNSNNYAVHYLGSTNVATATSYNKVDIGLTYSGTTVTATRDTSGAGETCGFVLIEFNGAALNQAVQAISKSWVSSGTSTTSTITSVNTSRSLIIYAGQQSDGTTNGARLKQKAMLTNSTTVTFDVNTANSQNLIYNCHVVEFVSGVLASSAQRGTTTISASSTSNTSTISSVTTSKSLLSFLGATTTLTTNSQGSILAGTSLTNSTTVTASRGGTSNAVTASWEVMEFN